MKINAIFMRKEPEIEVQECFVEAIESMTANKFYSFSKNLLKDYEFIEHNTDKMFRDSDGRQHCILAMNEDTGDGILIDASGGSCARYSAFVPNIKSYITEQISILADKILCEAIFDYKLDFEMEEVSQQYGMAINESNGIGCMLVECLKSITDIEHFEVEDGVIYLTLDRDMYPNHGVEMEENTIKILKVEPRKEPYVKEVANELSALQKEVGGGLIEAVYINGDVLVCNEEGKLRGMELNRVIGKDSIAGDFFICGEDGEEFVSLSDEKIEFYSREFGQELEEEEQELEEEEQGQSMNM